MEEVLTFAVIATIIVGIIALLAAGLAVVLALAVVVGIGLLIVRAAKAIFGIIERAHEESKRRALRLHQEQQAHLLRLQNEAALQELHRKEVEAQMQRDAAERQRQEQIRLRLTEEAAARQRLETERDMAVQTLLSRGRGLLVKRLSARRIDRIVEDSGRMQSHCGKHLHVIIAVGHSGVALEWKVHIAGSCVPQVIAFRGEQEMFREWAFAGRHTAALAPGRHVLAFRVDQQGQSEREIDLSFEVFVPAQATPGSLDAFKSAVATTTDEFVGRANTIAAAKQKLNDALVAEGNDADDIAIEMSKLEVTLSHLQSSRQEG